jgi:Zn2+/Cd2+-exporting ATPase
VHHSRRTLAIIRENITFSLGVKAVFVMLTFAGMGSLWGGERQEFLSMID